MKKALIFIMLVFCFAIVAQESMEQFDPVLYLDKAYPGIDTPAVVVGSYGGYWGLNDYFIGTMSNYFNLDQMKDIDRQIQEMMGIADLPYNYTGEAGSGYMYDAETDNWTYSGSRVGKHYDAISNTGFVINVFTAQVEQTIASNELATGSYANAVGTDVQIEGANYQILDARNWSPIIIDCNSNDKADVTHYLWTPHAPRFFDERTAVFDMSGDGFPDYIEWLGSEDSLLVMPEKDGSVKDAHNLFGTAGGYKDGYEKMSLVLDANHNGWVEGSELEGLFLWSDKNGNAKVDEGEMVPIEKTGVEKISTTHKNFQSVCYINGKEVKTWDWWPSGYELIKK